ncbi:MAG: metallophosphoesterase [Defluviitaleaceae bacterium]|nr:metallophosphoesterase [Defluviitaleaceae bacterium]
MRLFVTGDVHANHDYDKLKKFRHQKKAELTLDDYIVICGDFGILWDGDRHDKYFKEKVYGDFPCTILWVDGNHENFDALATYPIEEWNGGKVRRITDRILHLMRGEIFTLPKGEESIKIFALGGAMSTDRGYDTGNNRGWWPQELPSEDEIKNAINNLVAHKETVDYVFTHDAPPNVLHEANILDPRTGEIRRSDPTLSSVLGSLSRVLNFKGWYFGHHHRDLSHGKFHCLYQTIVELT